MEDMRWWWSIFHIFRLRSGEAGDERSVSQVVVKSFPISASCMYEHDSTNGQYVREFFCAFLGHKFCLNYSDLCRGQPEQYTQGIVSKMFLIHVKDRERVMVIRGERWLIMINWGNLEQCFRLDAFCGCDISHKIHVWHGFWDLIF